MSYITYDPRAPRSGCLTRKAERANLACSAHLALVERQYGWLMNAAAYAFAAVCGVVAIVLLMVAI